MAVKSKDELINSLKEIIGDSTDDKALAFIEDVTDTFSDFESKSSTDWEQKYKENDEEWRRKYKERFFNTEVDESKEDKPKDSIIPETNDNSPKTFDELFKTE